MSYQYFSFVNLTSYEYFADDFDGKSDDSADSDFDYANEELGNVEDEGNSADSGPNTQPLGEINWTEVAILLRSFISQQLCDIFKSLCR